MGLLDERALSHDGGVRVRHALPVAHVTLDRPEKRNALSLGLMHELLGVLRGLGADEEVHAIVLEGAGPAFSAGHDLSEMIGRDPSFYRRLFELCTELMLTIQSLPQPVVARVHGMATAAGCQLVASCDLAVAAEEARFATPGVRIGLFCSTPMVPISRAVGRKRALELLLTGEPIDSWTALDWGLINRVVPSAELDAAVDELVGQITRWSPLTIEIGKEAFYAQLDRGDESAYDLTKATMSVNALTRDAQEGMAAFLEKRPPRWTGS